ncbi:uncharacterized protein PAC_17555 [Phialocephala subalpina]|uniref:DUF7730 domain-containing protein n=1 Tax=Phialocephala subalpina TaxID=576137 RepID=A0A1L7XRH6_9HELO|nr:uncharacterized protein PAC_17555 [Phialocephala subalpina]
MTTMRWYNERRRRQDDPLKTRLSRAGSKAGENVIWISRCAATVLFFPLVVTYLAIETVLEERQEERDDGYRRAGPPPTFLKEPREKAGKKRNLAIQNKAPVMQSKSKLLMLPREIRDMIWKEVMGGKSIHWEIVDRKPSGRICRCEVHCYWLACMSWKIPNGHLEMNNMIGPLLSCKQMHLEAIGYLYELNRFWTRTTDVVRFLPRLLTAESLHRIRYLNFLYLVGDPPSLAHRVHRIDNPKKMEKRNQREHDYRRSWNGVWKTLSEVEGLVELKVQMIVSARRGTLDLWKVKDFEIVSSVTRPKRFVLILPDELVRLVKGRIHAENLEVEGL